MRHWSLQFTREARLLVYFIVFIKLLATPALCWRRANRITQKQTKLLLCCLAGNLRLLRRALFHRKQPSQKPDPTVWIKSFEYGKYEIHLYIQGFFWYLSLCSLHFCEKAKKVIEKSLLAVRLKRCLKMLPEPFIWIITTSSHWHDTCPG